MLLKTLYNTNDIVPLLKEHFIEITDYAISYSLGDLWLIPPPTAKFTDCLNFMYAWPDNKVVASLSKQAKFCGKLDEILAKSTCTLLVDGNEKPVKCAVHSKSQLQNPGWEQKKAGFEPVIQSAIPFVELFPSAYVCTDLNAEWEKRVSAQSLVEKPNKVSSKKAYSSTSFLSKNERKPRYTSSKSTSSNGIASHSPLISTRH